jgi:class 3 adenylate cyclase
VSDAGAEGHRTRQDAGLAQLGDVPFETLQERVTRLEIRFHETHCELVAAEAPGHVGCPGGVMERDGDPFEDAVALQVPERVIDLLERVDVAVDDREVAAVTPCARPPPRPLRPPPRGGARAAARGPARPPPPPPARASPRGAAGVAADRPAPPRAAMRDGTVTIVFTDIESSTEQAEAFGDERWFEVLSTHNRVVRGRLAEYGGVEVKSQGDGFMLTFPSARRALECMIAVQLDMAALRAQQSEHAVRIRVGAHTGEAIVGDDGDLFGLHVNIAARIAGQAAGDEILVSSLVREIVGTRGNFRFGEPRHTELKGVAGQFVLHPVLWAETP